MIIAFFRDVLDGPIYIIYVVICVILQFSLFGIIGDRKRKLIQQQLLEKKQRDIESGVEAEKAAMADKQILDVMDEEEEKKEDEEEAPSVLVIGADGSSEDNNE